MAKDTIIKLRVTSDEKEAAEALARARGVTLSAFIRKFISRSARRQSGKDSAA